MQLLEVPFISLPDIPGPTTAAAALDGLLVTPLNVNPWPQYEHSVQAGFSIAHCGSALLLKFRIKENYMLAAASANGDIHKDSCVEFFVALGDDENYYNLEFNCIGWHKTGYGFNREKRAPLPAAVAAQISTATSITATSAAGRPQFAWDITLVIPAAVFCYHNLTSFHTAHARGNFYKCGDDMPAPHFLTWNKVQSPIPDFHRKEDFAGIRFQ
ncbi:carbohydrate-binding family 9-like protein [uncultured Chitinophaga sp.]|uniref:carbohydrate-binding family 9-like protein n=1 Tax=uncultured Chitinophaga sp. TaxID=339340 RepID=UPI0025D95206|nr:carbohydrate-binding family 9-like protein [uncultured Chitinophaga sp.]